MADTVLKDCDLIMKGGVTSGVVYPGAIVALSRSYRLLSVGGTSAGAMAAVIAAAAEYRRQKGGGDRTGFDAVEKLPEELSGERLFRLFQPSPDLARLFRIVVRLYGSGAGGGGLARLPVWARAILVTLSEDREVAIGAGLAALVSLAGLVLFGWGWFAVALLLVVAIAALVVAALRLYRDVTIGLRRADFGMCPGIRTGLGLDRGTPKVAAPVHPGETADPAFGEWLHETIERVAGPGRNGILTVGDLEAVLGESKEQRARGIKVAAMTTDLSSQRPYQLPLVVPIHWFEEAEFRRVLPGPVVDYLKAGAATRTLHPDGSGHPLYRLKTGADFPVFLVARMSLSFPGLIAAVPLYREVEEQGNLVMRRCLFTDGGVSSNFPVHFFDSTLPRRPTFGIALGDLPPGVTSDDPAVRVRMPPAPRYNDWTASPPDPMTGVRAQEFTGLAGFLFGLLNCAKDWQDTLQSQLPGFSERIVTVMLKDSEGGLNLRMDPETVTRLAGYGTTAGGMLGQFAFDAHRNVRALVALPLLKEAGLSIGRAFAEGPKDHPYAALFGKPLDGATDDFNGWRAGELLTFAKALRDMAHILSDRPADVPHVDASNRVVAKPDLTLR